EFLRSFARKIARSGPCGVAGHGTGTSHSHMEHTGRGTTTLGPPVGTAVRSVTPRLPEAREKLIRAVAAIALIYATYWILWRWTNTINPEPRAIVPSLLLLIAET